MLTVFRIQIYPSTVLFTVTRACERRWVRYISTVLARTHDTRINARFCALGFGNIPNTMQETNG